MGRSTHTLMLQGKKPRPQTQGGVQVTGGVACLTGLSQSELHPHRPEGEGKFLLLRQVCLTHVCVCSSIFLRLFYFLNFCFLRNFCGCYFPSFFQTSALVRVWRAVGISTGHACGCVPGLMLHQLCLHLAHIRERTMGSSSRIIYLRVFT